MAAIATLDDLQQRISRGQRAALIRSGVLSVGIVAIAALFLWFTLLEVSKARTELASVESRIEAAATAQKAAEDARAVAERQLADAVGRLKGAQAEQKAAETALLTAQAEAETQIKKAQTARLEAEAARAIAEDQRAQAQEKLKDAQAAVERLTGQVTGLQKQIDRLQDQLTAAIDLGRYVYQLDWRDLKMIAASSGNAYRALEVIERRRQDVHWGMSNTPDGGYNSPGFARLVWGDLGSQRPFDQLSRQPGGDPRPGDIVVYESGYNMFFFRDYNQKPFVVGMTPFGVTALDYDFGVKVVAVLRTGLTKP